MNQETSILDLVREQIPSAELIFDSSANQNAADEPVVLESLVAVVQN